jgi:hypothetical protein
VKRREFITLLGGAAAAWPLTSHAQQATMPIIGYLSARSPDDTTHLVEAFRRSLNETGFIDGQNVTVEYRSASCTLSADCSVSTSPAARVGATFNSSEVRSLCCYQFGTGISAQYSASPAISPVTGSIDALPTVLQPHRSNARKFRYGLQQGGGRFR